MEEDSRKYTAFSVAGRGLYQWRVMPFGLHSAPATFQRALDSVIGPQMEPHAFAYLDDIIVIGRSLEEHLSNLREVFRRLREARLRINPDKCEFFKKETKYLGHVVSGNGIHTDPDKVAAIQEMAAPKTLKELRRFLGVVSWYRRFVPEFATLAQPLTSLLKKGKHWKWTEDQQTVFEVLKARLTQAPILACPDFTRQFILQTDASDYGLGAVLTQLFDDGERVIAYASRTLNDAEKNYSATEKECLAILWGIRKMRQYVEGYRFLVITDHLALKWLNSIDNPSGRLARWALELQQYTFTVQYRKGCLNVVADTLSRHPVESLQRAVEESFAQCPWLEQKMEAIRTDPKKFPDYSIVGTQLYRHIHRTTNDEDDTPWKLCVPTHLRERVLRENHSQPAAGHLGVRKTIQKTCGRYYWPGMVRDISRFVKSCDSCQVYKPSQTAPAGEMLQSVPDEPWATVCADFVGPMPRTKHGNCMLLVFIDRFTKWIEVVAMRKATAEGVVKAFRERILSRFGTPKLLITDNGSQFTSRILDNYLRHIGVRRQFTAPYCPQENPTERANRTIKTIIAQLAENQHNKWDEYLPEISLAVNSSPSESTGYSPAFLVQGREPRLPGALFDEVTTGTGARVIEPIQRADELQEVLQIVKRNIARVGEDQKRRYNLRRRKWTPAVGDLVLVKHHHLSKAVENFAAKLAPKFDGPFEVLSFKSPVIATVRRLNGKDIRNAHLGDMKPYVSLSEHTNKHIITTSKPMFSSSTDTNKSTMEQISKTPRTKAFYKQQYQLIESLKPCSVQLTKLTEDEIEAARQPVKRLHNSKPTEKKSSRAKKRQLPSLKVVETIVISSDDEEPCTPPRRAPQPQDHPVTPPPTVSPLSPWFDLTNELPPTPGRGILNLGLPPTPGRSIFNPTSPRYASDSESEPRTPRKNIRLENCRSPCRPVLPSAIVVPSPPASSDGEIPFLCREMLSEEVKRGLQSCIKEALRRHSPPQPYKRIFTIVGQKFRVLINRQGKIIVTKR